MERIKPGPSQSSSYGRACMQCYRAKCRCVPAPNGNNACERCLRLKKNCHPSDSARRRIIQRADESDKRIAQLEGKIETLLSAMQSVTSTSGASANVAQLPTDEIASSLSAMLGSAGISTVPASTGSSSGEALTPGTDTSPAALSATDPFSPFGSDMTPRQMEESLQFFRSRMLPSFPFIHLDPEVSAWQLHHDRPFLLRAILTVTTFSTAKKLPRANRFKDLVCNSVLIDVQSNIDLLLGVLTYLTWSTDVFIGRADLISRLMMIAISLVYDLRLFKPTPPDVHFFMIMAQDKADPNETAGDQTVLGFMEKQRALLACFILSSNISSHLGRQDALRWTPRMEEALKVVEMNKSFPNDNAFAIQVRLHLIKQRAAHIREQHEVDSSHTATASAMSALPGLLYLKTLRSQLHELQSSFPTDLYQRNIVIANAQYVELYINQLAYSISWDSPPLNISVPRGDSGLLPGFERLQCLWQSVENIKSWLENFSQVPPSEMVGLPFHFWSQMIVCALILKYLSTLSDPSWDCQAVRNTIDMIEALDSLGQNLDLGSKESGLDGDDNIFVLLHKLMFRCRQWAETWWNLPLSTRSSAAEPTLEDYDGGVGRQSSNIPNLDQMVMIQSMNLDSEEWLENMLKGGS
ncbi:putative C6 transcription factor [Xylariales sp. PMI_506]|nr:putative C6 transcription factor [Xylariales sp. PMI_506]